MRKGITLSLALLAGTSMAVILEPHQQVIMDAHENSATAFGADPSEMRHIELGPDNVVIMTESEKWELKKSGKKFMDITDHKDLGKGIVSAKRSYKYPAKPQHEDVVRPLLEKLEKKHMEENLETFTNFWTRYYRSDYGKQSSEWLLKKVEKTCSKNKNINVAAFEHDWAQSSIIAHIPVSASADAAKKKKGDDDYDDEPRVSKTHVVIGAHQDSVNLWMPMLLKSPGADDDGSGTVTILEAFRVLANSDVKLKNPLEFHWYSAEEGGLLGSQAIFEKYAQNGVLVGAMLQQDMTGYFKPGTKESVGVIHDFVDPELTRFIKSVIETYCDIPWVKTECGYACSDHASASKAGYPSAFVIESEFRLSNQHIHGTEDKIEHLSFDHMLQHAKMTLALAVELGLADLE